MSKQRGSARPVRQTDKPTWVTHWEKTLEILKSAKERNHHNLADLGYSPAWQEKAQRLMGRISVFDFLLNGGLDAEIEKLLKEERGETVERDKTSLSGRIAKFRDLLTEDYADDF